jgi:hypothetical protein
MRRTFRLPMAIALLAGPLTWLIQSVLRLATVGHAALQSLLGPAPNVVVGLCFPFAALAYPFDTLTSARRAVAITAAATVGILVIFEVWRPIAGAQTFDPLDIVGSIVGGVVGTLLARLLARRTDPEKDD